MSRRRSESTGHTGRKHVVVAWLGRLIVAGFAGTSIWLSLGTLVVTNGNTISRMAALPPMWLLPTLAAAVLVAFVVCLPHSRGTPLLPSILIWLPYLPGRIPAGFLIWQGPLEALVWLLVLLGFIIESRGLGRSFGHRWLTDPTRAPFAAALIASVCATGAFINVKGVVPAGDEPHYLVITQSLLLDGDLRVENNHRRGDYLSYFMWEFGPHYLRRGADGEIYSSHAPGVSAIVLPGFRAAGYFGAVGTIILLVAAAGAVAWRTAWLLTREIGAAWAGWAAVALTSPFFLLSFAISPDGVAGLLTAQAMLLLVQLDVGIPIRRTGLVVASAGLALLPWLHTRFVVVAATLAAILGVRLAARASRWMDLLSFSVVPALSAVGWFSYFWLIWGTPDPSAQWGTGSVLSIGNLGQGVLGILADQQFGLLPNAPIYGIAAIGVVWLARQRPRLACEILLVGLPYLAIVSSYSDWWGGVGAPARFLGVLVPLAVLPLASWWSAQRSEAWRTVTALTLGISFLAVAARVFIGHGALLFNDSDGYDKLLDWLSQSADIPMAMASLHREPVLVALVDASIWILAVVITTGVVTYELSRRQWSREVQWVLLSLGVTASVMAAATAVWARHGVSGATADRSKLAAIGEWDPLQQPTTVALPPFQLIDRQQFIDRLRIAGTDRVRTRDRSVLFAASSVPAADYELTISGASAAQGEIYARVGDVDLRLDRWELEARTPGFTGAVLRLPVRVQRLMILGNPQAIQFASSIGLRLKRAVEPAAPGVAARAARYGAVRVFPMDDAVFLEPPGFWTHGNHSTTLVIDVSELPPDKDLIVRLRSGPVEVPLELRHSTWRTAMTMAPQQQTDVTVPRSRGQREIVLSILTGSGFRLVDFVQGGDGRSLGVWLEFI